MTTLLRRLLFGRWGGSRSWSLARTRGLSLWLDASRTSTLTLDTAAVSAWADRSDAGRDVTATGDARPAWAADAASTGQPGVTFDGTDDVMTRSEAWAYAAGSATVFLVATYTTPATGRYVIGEGSTSSNNPQYSLLRTNPSTAASATSFIASDAGATVLSNVPAGGSSWGSTIQLLSREDTGLAVTAYRNGTVGNSSTYTRAATTPNAFAIGARSRATPDNFAAVTIHELLIIAGRVPGTSERQRIEGSLAHKWGIEANLPSDHPWKNAPPPESTPGGDTDMTFDAETMQWDGATMTWTN